MRIFAILAALAIAPLAAAHAGQATPTEVVLGRVFSEIERQVIEEYYRNRGEVTHDERGAGGKKKSGRGHGNGDLPPGLAKRDDLPPGLEMQLERSGRLPPGIEKRDLPAALAARLAVRHGAEAQVVGSDVLLVDTVTGVILDILRNVARP